MPSRPFKMTIQTFNIINQFDGFGEQPFQRIFVGLKDENKIFVEMQKFNNIIGHLSDFNETVQKQNQNVTQLHLYFKALKIKLKEAIIPSLKIY